MEPDYIFLSRKKDAIVDDNAGEDYAHKGQLDNDTSNLTDGKQSTSKDDNDKEGHEMIQPSENNTTYLLIDKPIPHQA